jgi:DNA-binding HxlR family transcriptional regulator
MSSDFEADVFNRHCPSRDILQTVTGRWGALALAALFDGSYRFNALRRRVDGVSERMLSQTLQQLERDGMVTRTVHQTIPPQVEYALTDLGRDVAGHLIDLIETVQAGLPTVTAARAAHDRRNR